MYPFFGTEGVHGISHPFVDNILNGRSKKCQATFFVAVSLLTFCCHGLPTATPSKEDFSNSAVSHAVKYLTKYGYLPPSDPASGNLRTDRQLREAISSMQLYGNVKTTGVIDEATMELMHRRRCGLPDVIPGGAHRVRRYAIQGQKWPVTNLTWSVKSRDPATDIKMVRSQLRRAFDVWSAASVLTFVEVQGSSADIVVSFLKGQHGDGYPFDGEGSVLAHAFFPGDGIGGDAHLDAEEKWLPIQPQDENEGVNLFAVAAHEIGHSLGLSHSSAPGSLMFPYYQVMDESFTLPKDDAEGIRHIYGFKEDDILPTMPTLSPTSTALETTPTATTNELPTKKTTLKPRKTTKTPPKISPAMPDMCNTSIDAISVIRREVFVFKGQYFWRLYANRTVRSGYPVEVSRFWYALPTNITKIDAIYERPADTKIVFFIGKQFWLFSANQLEEGYPRPLTDLGLPSDLERIDAAIVWGHNGKTFFFSGKEYWKYDEEEERVELDYPRNILPAWRGVPTNMDAAFQWTDGNTYFFKGTKFWKFLDTKMKIESKGPSEIGGFWFKCPSKAVEQKPKLTVTTAKSEVEVVTSTASMPNICSDILIILLVCLLKLKIVFLT